jgi:hypothetical protein
MEFRAIKDLWDFRDEKLGRVSAVESADWGLLVRLISS